MRGFRLIWQIRPQKEIGNCDQRAVWQRCGLVEILKHAVTNVPEIEFNTAGNNYGLLSIWDQVRDPLDAKV